MTCSRKHRSLPAPHRHAFHLAVGYVFWLCCTGVREQADLWAGGVAACLFAAFAGIVLPHDERFRLRALPRFGVFFILQSCKAAVHVARLALRPGVKPQSQMTQLRSALPPGAPRAVFANLVSLLPGSLSANLVDDIHHIHVLHLDHDPEADLRHLERQVARLFGLSAP